MAEAVYVLCALTSLVCAGVLLRSYRRNPMRLILLTSLCFVGLAVNNVLLFIDLVVIPDDIDLRIVRHLAALAGAGILLAGMIGAEVD